MAENHNHEHQHAPLQSKIEQALGKYNCNISDAEVAAAVKKIIDEKVQENNTEDVKRFMFGSIELTTLTTLDSAESVLQLVEKVNRFAHEYPDMPHVATVVTYPRFTKLVSESLEVDGVIPTCVSGAFLHLRLFWKSRWQKRLWPSEMALKMWILCSMWVNSSAVIMRPFATKYKNRRRLAVMCR